MILAYALLAAAQAGTVSQPLIIDRGRADRVPVPELPRQEPKTQVRRDATAALTRVEVTGTGQPILGIRFDGARVPAEVARAAETFVSKPANRETLELLAAAMSDAYGKSDVALYSIGIPDQDLTSGTVVVQVTQGFYAERLRAIRPLTRPALERQLSLMSDVSGATVVPQLLLGSQVGGVILSLAITRKRIKASAGYDNTKSPLLGRGRFNAELTLNSLIRDGDQTTISGQIARDFESFAYVSGSHSTPLGASGLKLGLTGAFLRTDAQAFNLRGDAVAAGLSLSYPVIRSYRKNLVVSGGIDMVNSDSALYGLVLSNDRIRTGRLAAGYSSAGTKSVLSLGATVSKGLGILGERGAPGQSDPLFTKANLTAGYDRALGKRVVARLRGMGQYSADLLPATERIAIGGPDYGRVFDLAAVTGDSGIAGSFELGFRPLRAKRVEATEIYGFVDYAKVFLNDRIGFPATSYPLGSVGGGVRLAYSDFARINVEAAKAIKDPFGGAYGDWRVNVSWKLSLPGR